MEPKNQKNSQHSPLPLFPFLPFPLSLRECTSSVTKTDLPSVPVKEKKQNFWSDPKDRQVLLLLFVVVLFPPPFLTPSPKAEENLTPSTPYKAYTMWALRWDLEAILYPWRPPMGGNMNNIQTGCQNNFCLR